MRSLFLIALSTFAVGCASMSKPQFLQPKAPARESRPLVMMTDFGVRDGAVSAMKGVAYGVSRSLVISDLSHQIEPFNIWEGAYRLHQTATYWPADSVFVTVIDPGVGSERKSIVAKTKSGQLFVNPDNGLLTLISENPGIEEVREIDETKNRLKGSSESYTFHGRDLYAYTGARLAAGVITFEEVGPKLTTSLVTLDYQKPVVENGVIKGQIPVLDINYGNVWTNIPKFFFIQQAGKSKLFKVNIFDGKKRVYSGTLPVGNTFHDVKKGEPLLYMNSLLNVAIALNQGSFAQKYRVQAGTTWRVEITPVK